MALGCIYRLATPWCISNLSTLLIMGCIFCTFWKLCKGWILFYTVRNYIISTYLVNIYAFTYLLNLRYLLVMEHPLINDLPHLRYLLFMVNWLYLLILRSVLILLENGFQYWFHVLICMIKTYKLYINLSN